MNRDLLLTGLSTANERDRGHNTPEVPLATGSARTLRSVGACATGWSSGLFLRTYIVPTVPLLVDQ